MFQLEIIKLARYVTSIWSLLAFAILILYLVAAKVLQEHENTKAAPVPFAFRSVVFTKVFYFSIVVVVAGAVIKVLPLLAFQDTPVHGVVLRKGAQTTVASAKVSLDGFAELGTSSDPNGNFRLTVPASRREDDYVVRAQLDGEGGIAKVKDADAPKTSVSIELPPPPVAALAKTPSNTPSEEHAERPRQDSNGNRIPITGWHKEWRGNDPDTAVAHYVGRPAATQWTVSSRDEAGAFLFGPYATLAGGTGTYQAFWVLSLNEQCPTDDKIVTFDVFDSDARTLIESLSVKPSSWAGRVTEYKEFRLGFHRQTSELTHKYEFRIHWYGGCGITLNRFGVVRSR